LTKSATTPIPGRDAAVFHLVLIKPTHYEIVTSKRSIETSIPT